MNIGKILSFISPAAGMMTGNGAGMLPYLSPGFGAMSGKGPFGKMVGGGEGGGFADALSGAMGGGMGGAGGLDIEQLMKLLQGGGHDPSANYLNMFGGG